MRAVLLFVLAGIGALLPWAVLAYALRAARRRFRPRRIVRSRRLPVTRPGNPLGASLLLVFILVVIVAWAAFTRPLWRDYVLDALDYRENAAPLANRVSSELIAAGRPLSTAGIGRGRFSYSLGPGTEAAWATVTYYWRGVPQLPGAPTDPVDSRRRDGPDGALVLVYRRDLAAAQLEPIIAAFNGINLDPAGANRRAAVDLPLLLRSVYVYLSEGYAGNLDTPAAVARFLAGLPVLPPLYAAGLAIGLWPSW